ncbi:hypothetical protein DESC_700042 [Desulfosarcina cetonica]|nr:hypothetical protein DESC_700042 [Desulfosarcina cetonica]
MGFQRDGQPQGENGLHGRLQYRPLSRIRFSEQLLETLSGEEESGEKTAGQRSGADAVRLRMDPHVRLGAAFIQHPLTGRHARIGAIFYPPPPRRC